jgi:mycofactocin biosynthetic radical S-adenosylmethionine protein MftC
VSQTAPVMKNAYREITQASWKKARPIQALFELTYRCNHLCTFCNNPLSREGAELDTQEAFSVIAQLKELGVLFVTLTGGEPLLRKDFWEIAEECRRQRLAIRVFSNAYLIDDAVADRLKELSVVETSISIHGSRPEVHEKLTRIPGSFQRVVDAVGRLRARGMRVILKTPVTRLNENDLFDIKKIADDHGAFMVFDTTITPRFDGDVSPLGLAPSEDFYRWFWSPEGAPLRNGVQPKPRTYAGREELEGCCGTGRSGLMVDPYGSVYPCALWFRKLGNVREQTLTEIWEGSQELKKVRQIAKEVQDEVIPQQEAGEFMSWCPATAEAMTGDAKQAYRPAILNSKYMKLAYQAEQALVQIEGLGPAASTEAAEACPHD